MGWLAFQWCIVQYLFVLICFNFNLLEIFKNRFHISKWFVHVHVHSRVKIVFPGGRYFLRTLHVANVNTLLVVTYFLVFHAVTPFNEGAYRRWGDKTLYLKNFKCSGEPKNMAALTLLWMGLPSFYYVTVALSFQIEICNLDRTKSSFLATSLYKKVIFTKIELRGLATIWLFAYPDVHA